MLQDHWMFYDLEQFLNKNVENSLFLIFSIKDLFSETSTIFLIIVDWLSDNIWFTTVTWFYAYYDFNISLY